MLGAELCKKYGIIDRKWGISNASTDFVGGLLSISSVHWLMKPYSIGKYFLLYDALSSSLKNSLTHLWQGCPAFMRFSVWRFLPFCIAGTNHARQIYPLFREEEIIPWHSPKPLAQRRHMRRVLMCQRPWLPWACVSWQTLHSCHV